MLMSGGLSGELRVTDSITSHPDNDQVNTVLSTRLVGW